MKRLRFYTSALLEGSVTPDHIAEDWPDWFQLAPAFVAAYGSYELQELEIGAEFLEAIEEQDDVSLTDAVRAYLKALQAWLDVYPEMRTTEERPDSALWERPVDGGEEIGVLEMQVSWPTSITGTKHGSYWRSSTSASLSFQDTPISVYSPCREPERRFPRRPFIGESGVGFGIRLR